MKPSLKATEHRNLLKTSIGTTGWSLCVGAGTSCPVFPSWAELIRILVSTIDPPRAAQIAKDLLSLYSPDAVLDSVYELLGVDEDKYVEILSEWLFSILKKLLNPSDFNLFCRILSQGGPERIPDKDWLSFISLRDKYVSGTSAYQIAKVICDAIDKNCEPVEILSFNAESLLFSLIDSFIYQKFVATRLDRSKHPKRVLDFVNRSISPHNRDRIKYIFNHGVLPVPGNAKKAYTHAADKLVFREGEYLGLANNAFSWQSSLFMSVSGERPIVFVGVSLSDQNMRRWLTWIQNNRSHEILMATKNSKISTRHFWINKRPSMPHMETWIEACVFHLGVRIVWIDDWNTVGLTLSEMLGI